MITFICKHRWWDNDRCVDCGVEILPEAQRAESEPTDEQLRAANTLIVRQQGLPDGYDLSMAPLVQVVAHAFADREAAIHARYAIASEQIEQAEADWAREVYKQEGLDMAYARGRRDQADEDICSLDRIAE